MPGTERQRTSAQGGSPWRDPQDMLSGILWVLRTGAPWAGPPGRYPPYCYSCSSEGPAAFLLLKKREGEERDFPRSSHRPQKRRHRKSGWLAVS
ncbi:transposase [Corallococcus sp. AB049A]|nr:transposase [Corallococcus sp. AB049A]